jgi:hypothetical protein
VNSAPIGLTGNSHLGENICSTVEKGEVCTITGQFVLLTDPPTPDLRIVIYRAESEIKANVVLWILSGLSKNTYIPLFVFIEHIPRRDTGVMFHSYEDKDNLF